MRRKRSPPSRTRSTISKRTRANMALSGVAGRGGDAAHALPAFRARAFARSGREAFVLHAAPLEARRRYRPDTLGESGPNIGLAACREPVGQETESIGVAA